MHLPHIIAAVLVARQAAQIIPEDYCSPGCPTCKTEITAFNVDTSCAVNSTFISFCGECLQCVVLYGLENPDAGTNYTETNQTISALLDQCNDSSGAEEIKSVEAQITRIETLVATASTTPTGDWTTLLTTAPTPIATSTSTSTWDGSMGDPTGAWTSILSTAKWGGRYSSRLSAASVAAAESSSLSVANARNSALTALAAHTTNATTISTPTATPSPFAPSAPLNKSWVAGPVIGSLLGVSTVFIVIYFTRRRMPPPPPPSLPPKRTQSQSTSSTSSHHNSLAFKAQLHSDCIPIGELDNTMIHEMPAKEPVGMEMSSPRRGRAKSGDGIEEDVWVAMPISPLPALFKEVEMRDEKEGEEVKHETFYNP